MCCKGEIPVFVRRLLQCFNKDFAIAAQCVQHGRLIDQTDFRIGRKPCQKIVEGIQIPSVVVRKLELGFQVIVGCGAA